MGKDLRGKELGKGISQRNDGYYVGRFTDKYGKRKNRLFKKLQECRQWLADSKYQDEHSNINFAGDMTVDAWFEYWIGIKGRTVRPNTVRNYRERYKINIRPVIGDKLLINIKTIDCQNIMNKMADLDYRTSTIYQARITLYNMLEYAYQNDVIMKNPCNSMVKSNIGKPSSEKKALTLEQHKLFLNGIKESAYGNQYRFILQTGIRTGELVGLKWKDIDLKKRTISITRSMEFRHSIGEWRTGEPKSKSGYRTIPLTEEGVCILEEQKKRNNNIKVIPAEWSEYVFL